MKSKEFIFELNKYAIDGKAEFLSRFFKTGPGEYGEGDKFLGVRVPQTRIVCKLFKDMPLNEVQRLLDSPFHEHRLGGAILLANKYPRADEQNKQKIYDIYLANVKASKINNWDIVDVSCAQVVGTHLLGRDRKILSKMAKNGNLWEKRTSMVCTFAFLRKGDPSTTIALAEILLNDKHDLIQKAVGWMLRETGKKVDEDILISFLDENAAKMPRTMLRYSIERLPAGLRRKYMNL